MSNTTRVMDLELTEPPPALPHGGDLEVLVRVHGQPVGSLRIPTPRSPEALGRTVVDRLGWNVVCHLLGDELARPARGPLRMDDLLGAPHASRDGTFPLVTVAVCTRDRAESLGRCLDALVRLDYPALDLLVVDNAPTTDATERLVRSGYPSVRYTREPRPGLDWARNRAIDEARGEILAYTDDDVVVDPGWVAALASVFAENPEVMAVTGLVLPYELETESQRLFEQYGGFGRGFLRKWYRVDLAGGERAATHHGGAGKFGTGANMAFRREVFDEIGAFDPALDVGTVTNGGGDLEMFFRVLKEGHTLVYEPAALVRHCHRRTYEQLKAQIANNGVGFYSYLVRSALAYPDERAAFVRLGLWWFWWWSVRRLVLSYFRPVNSPRDLIVAELAGSLVGLGRYPKARRNAARIAKTFDSGAGERGPRSRGE